METILIIAGISGVLALALIGYVNFRSKKRTDKPDLTIKIPLKTDYSIIEYELGAVITNHRQDIRLNTLFFNDTISIVCQEHSLNMASIFKLSHTNAFLRGAKLTKALNIKHSSEVVAYGQGTAQGILKMWLKSPTHKKAIEGKGWTKFGLSIEKSILRRNYTTCIFTK